MIVLLVVKLDYKSNLCPVLLSPAFITFSDNELGLFIFYNAYEFCLN